MAKFQFENLTLILQADYSYVSDPPLFADIGTATILLSGLSLSFEFQSELTFTNTDTVFTVNMDNMDLRFIGDNPLAQFEGYSDFSTVAQNTINVLGAVIENRASSLINE